MWKSGEPGRAPSPSGSGAESKRLQPVRSGLHGSNAAIVSVPSREGGEPHDKKVVFRAMRLSALRKECVRFKTLMRTTQ
jgi:hypothetical protein